MTRSFSPLPGTAPASVAVHRTSPFGNPLALLALVGGMLAISTVFAKAAPGAGWHPLALLQWSVLGGALLLLLARRRLTQNAAGQTEAPDAGAARKRLLFMIGSGVLFILPNMIAVSAAHHVGAGFVSLTYAFPLVLTYAVAVFIGLERFTAVRSLGVLFGLAGGVLLAISGKAVTVEASSWSLFALSIPLFLAVGNIYRTVKWPAGSTPVDLAIGMMLVGFVVLAMFSTVMEIPQRPVGWTAANLGLLVAQTAIYGLQYGLYFRLQQISGPVYLSQIGSVAAVFGLGLGYLVFGEVPDAAKLAAAVAVALGIVFVSKGKR